MGEVIEFSSPADFVGARVGASDGPLTYYLIHEDGTLERVSEQRFVEYLDSRGQGPDVDPPEVA